MVIKFEVNKDYENIESITHLIMSLSDEFCTEHRSIFPDEYKLKRISNEAIELICGLSISVRNRQDAKGFSTKTNPIIGRGVKYLSEEKIQKILASKRLTNDPKVNVNLRDVLNRFAHITEDKHCYRVEGKSHHLVIVHPNKSKTAKHAMDFTIADFCSACNRVAKA